MTGFACPLHGYSTCTYICRQWDTYLLSLVSFQISLKSLQLCILLHITLGVVKSVHAVSSSGFITPALPITGGIEFGGGVMLCLIKLV